MFLFRFVDFLCICACWYYDMLNTLFPIPGLFLEAFDRPTPVWAGHSLLPLHHPPRIFFCLSLDLDSLVTDSLYFWFSEIYRWGAILQTFFPSNYFWPSLGPFKPETYLQFWGCFLYSLIISSLLFLQLYWWTFWT